MTWEIIAGLILLFGVVVVRGAPYVPTHRRSVGQALDLLNIEKGDLIIDLGSGDGNVLKAAAQRGYRALGYELNPILCVVSMLRCLPQRSRVTVLIRDFWITEWPADAKAVFVFLAGPYMNRLSRRLQKEMSRRSEPLTVISHGFAIPGFLPKKIADGMYFYELKPDTKQSKPQWNPRQEHKRLKLWPRHK
ncbi:MAG TPA: hypothetical protein VFO38_01760 [Candidatus Saccharimonadales bacterium]|nr:hypothetical protein [Candidatus Saccharimonadales bacterium]